MKYYFQLQYIRCTRFLREVGIHPILAGLFFLAVFIIVSTKTVHSISYGQWIYILLSVALFARIKKGDLMRISFPIRTLRFIGIIESLIFSLPFGLFLGLNQFYLEALILLSINGALSLIDRRLKLSYYLPTPFRKRPFEFIVGFRKTWVILLLLYGLCVIAMIVGNLNLGVVSIGFIYLTLLGYYTKSEDEIFVWAHNVSPTNFLLRKVTTAFLYSSLCTMPLGVSMLFVFPENWLLISILFLGGTVPIILSVLNKYCYFPHDSELINGILIAIGVLFPPLLPIIAIYLFNKASQNLKKYL